MKSVRLITTLAVLLIVASCGTGEKKVTLPIKNRKEVKIPEVIPIDKGFSEYIAGYTSGIIPSNGIIEIRFTPDFAAKAEKVTSGLFTFDPVIKGKTEWKDETTIIFTPARLIDAGIIYTGTFNLGRLAQVKDRLKEFPLRIQTRKKDFIVRTGAPQCSSTEGTVYTIDGELISSDFVNPQEAENYLEAKLGRKKVEIKWDHSQNPVHKFTIENIERSDKKQNLTVSWDGKPWNVRQKGSESIDIPPIGEFSIISVSSSDGTNQRIDIVFSDPLDASREIEGLAALYPSTETTTTVSMNMMSILPLTRLTGPVTINVEQSVRSKTGATLKSSFSKDLDFTSVTPGIMEAGKGVIIPASENLIFPFRAANLNAVDLKIIRIFENNLPWFLQEYDINGGYSVKRFGRPVFSGKVDLTTGGGAGNGWNLYTIDLSDYIDVEPGILYKVVLSMKKSYSTWPGNNTRVPGIFEQRLAESEQQNRDFWDDPDNYYEDAEDEIYYSSGFSWEDRDDPSKDAYYSPDKKVTRNILASNFGIIAKKGDDNILHVSVNDLVTATPVNEASIEVYDYQLQVVASGNTGQNGSAALKCERKPFLVVAKKEKDRNYLKLNDGSSLSLSSFDVAGNKPESGIKAFIYGERDVWRPGDSIFLSIFIKDMKNNLPQGHPVQFELINPLEQKIDNQVQKADRTNLLVFSTKTPADALTGNYKAIFRIGGALFTKRIRVETIKPNRLKMELNFADNILGGSKAVNNVSLNVKWLNGSVAGHVKSSVEYLLKPVKTEFEKYRQFNFDDPVNQFYAETVTSFDGEADASGNANFSFNPGREIIAPGMLNVVFTAKATEPGGDQSITQISKKYAPYPVFAGITLPGLKGKSRMLNTDADNEVKIVTVDESGKLVKSDVEITIYKISYRWWWESDQEDLASYIYNDTYKPVIRGRATTSGGEASFRFKIDKKDWGRYLIRATTPQGHSTGTIVLVDWPSEYGSKGTSDGATLLAISTDKEKYNPGNEVKLSFPAPANARAIITLENATGIIDEIYTNTKEGTTSVSFMAKPEMAPNVYAYVSVIQPHAQTVNDMPIRLYGVVPVMVEDKESRLSPVIEVADEIRSQKPFTVKVTEQNGKAMTYTLAIVDEGLLGITAFRTPDPWSHFFSREALGVQTWDLYDLVLGSYGGTLERIFAIGGDEAVIDRSANKAQRFVPVVRFLGPFTLNSGRSNTHTITIPQYTGSVRTMVIAGSDKAYGFAEKSVFVKDPLMVLVTAPRVVSPGEKVALPVTVFIQKQGINDITVTASGNDLVKFDGKTVSIQNSGIGEQTAELSFTTGEKRGVAKISVNVSGGGETAVYDMEIEVRSPNPPETHAIIKTIGAGEKWETAFNSPGAEGSGTASLEVSPLPSINLTGRMDYLLDYPHGCSEQIVSAAFPQLWLAELSGNDSRIKTSASSNITDAIMKINGRQMPSGGVALWPGSAQADNWVTSYAGHFLAEAERKGFSVPSSFKQKWLSFQRSTARDWKYDPLFKQSANDQAYRLFTLALAGQPEKGAMNRLRESASIPALSRWLLAAAYATTGRTEVASDLLDVRDTATEPEYAGYYYGSEVRDKAIILYTLSLLKNRESALPLVKELCDKLGSTEWYSTQSVAWGLFSYMKWAGLSAGNTTGKSKINISINGSKSEQVTGQGTPWREMLKITNGKNALVVENSSSNPVYATLTLKGVPAVSEIKREETGMTMKIDYLDRKLNPVDQKNLSQGTDFIMMMKVTNSTFTSVDNIALTAMIPSGWEIQNTRLFDAGYGIKESSYDYRDFRDDRVNTYFSLSRGETKTFTLILSAAYKGEFYQPPVWCEAMYTGNFWSRYPGTTVKVTGR